jgi:tetratricopeptide (TPR) repeat protein
MPTRTYMGVDARHDHSFRIPRPDLAEATSAPNACLGCHEKRSAAWAASAALRWWGAAGMRRTEAHGGEAIHAGRENLAGAARALARLVEQETKPPIVRATALSLFAGEVGAAPSALIAKAVGDPDPLVRRAAATAAQSLPGDERLALLSPLLSDLVRTVRADAARALAALPREQLSSSTRTTLEAALADWLDEQRINEDRAESHLNLGLLHAEQGSAAAAEEAYQTAIRLEPALGAAYVNLGDLYRQQGRDLEGERLLRQGLTATPRDAGVHHALGLTLVRLKRVSEALPELQRAAELAPHSARYAYVFGMALDATGDPSAAARVLAKASSAHPGSRELLQALALTSAKAGDPVTAADAARRLRALAQPP